MPRKYKRKIGRPKKRGPKPRKPPPHKVSEALGHVELKRRLQIELERTGGHISRTAWLMNIGRTAVYRWVKRFELWPLINRIRRQRLEGAAVQPSNLIAVTRLASKE